MPGYPVFTGIAFLGVGLVLLVEGLRRGLLRFAAWTDDTGRMHAGGGWHLLLSVLLTTCGLFNLWHAF